MLPLIRRITSPIPNNKKNTIGNEPCIKVEIITFVVVSFSFLSYRRINKKDYCVNCDLILQEESRRGSSGSFFLYPKVSNKKHHRFLCDACTVRFGADI